MSEGEITIGLSTRAVIEAVKRGEPGAIRTSVALPTRVIREGYRNGGDLPAGVGVSTADRNEHNKAVARRMRNR
jgi:hypothetical protein